MLFNIFVVLVLLLCASEVHPQNFKGKPCHHAAKNLQGTCTLLRNCKSVLDDVQNQVMPQFCGLADTAPYACCPMEEVGAKSCAKCLEYSKVAKHLCSMRLGTNYKISEFAVGREFPHMGDLGGSLLLQSAEVDCMYDLVGMFIHVRNCSETDGQEVYTRVSYYIDWIESIVWP